MTKRRSKLYGRLLRARLKRTLCWHGDCNERPGNEDDDKSSGDEPEALPHWGFIRSGEPTTTRRRSTANGVARDNEIDDGNCDCRDCIRLRNRRAGIEEPYDDSESGDEFEAYLDRMYEIDIYDNSEADVEDNCDDRAEEMDIDRGSETDVEDNCDDP